MRMTPERTVPLYEPEHFINRELSWLAFNQRVLMEAANADNPVFERMKFLSIVSSNLDEFFMIRVASLRDQCNAGIKRTDDAGMSPKQQLNRVMPRIQRMIRDQYDIFAEHVLPELAACGLRFVRCDALDAERAAWVDRYFQREVYPVLTPMAVDANRPFPHILNRSLNLGVLLVQKQGDRPDFATVQVPTGLPRVLRLPIFHPEQAGCDFVLLEDLIASHIHRLFVGRRVLCCTPYRITRSGDFPIDEEDVEDILVEVEKSVKKRKWGAVIRLEIAHDAQEALLHTLRHALEATREEVYPIGGPINLDFLMKQVYGTEGYDAQRFVPFTPHRTPELDVEGEAFFAAIAEKDRLLHHPYDSFEPVLRFVQEAARDPQVVAIKQTLYRVSGHSPIVRALEEAAEAGKQVTVLLEVKARFDEENNIHWGKRLEHAGCHVVYGLRGLKTHAKITLVVRREEQGIRRYVHLATGNYNDITANLYTDMGLFTAKPEFGEDASELFNMLTGYSEAPELRKLIYAPNNLRGVLLERIRREEQHALAGHPAGIAIKTNSLLDAEMAGALCHASCAGVTVRLLVRGICCLRPGIARLSERIHVHSIVGRFLEHSRIFCFTNGGEEEIFLSSADWMPRNLDRRVELMFPLEDEAVCARVREVFRQSWRDTEKTWMLDAKGKYARLAPDPARERLNVQQALIEEAERASAEAARAAENG